MSVRGLRKPQTIAANYKTAQILLAFDDCQILRLDERAKFTDLNITYRKLKIHLMLYESCGH